MRSSTVFALAALAAAPAFAAPLVSRDATTTPPTDESGAIKITSGLIKDGVEIANGVVNGVQGIKNLFSREELELLARQAEQDQSGAIKISSGLIKDGVEIGHGVINGAQGIKNLFNREELELLARQAPTQVDESGALNLGKIVKTVAGFLLKREEMELMARQQPTDESGALNIGKIVSTAAGVLSHLFNRDELEIMARADPQDESGALNIGHIVSTAASVLGSLFNRDEIAVMARADPTDESCALNLGKIVKTVAGFLLKREEELMARDVTADQSGALNIGKIVSTAAGVLGQLFNRDELEVLARADPQDESGALNIGKIISTVAGLLKREELEAREPRLSAFRFGHGPVITSQIARDVAPTTDESGALNIGHIISTVAGIASNFLKREELELLAREPLRFQPPVNRFPALHFARDVQPQTDESGALNIGHIISTVAGIASNFLKREELEELLAREPYVINNQFGIPARLPNFHTPIARDVAADQSGALNLGKIISTVASFLKREELERSLNELD